MVASPAFMALIGTTLSSVSATDAVLQNKGNLRHHGKEIDIASTRRDLQSADCIVPDSTTFPIQGTGEYSQGSRIDCFYMHWDTTKCNGENSCPLFIYVDGTTNAQDIDNRDTVFMEEMAKQGYVTVTVDYDDAVGGYTDGCPGFESKSRSIFGDTEGTVLDQLCNSESPLHDSTVPVDCTLGVATSGWSQGAHIAALAGNYASTTHPITGSLLFGNGNSNRACLFLVCTTTSVPCVNSENLVTPKERRRSLVGESDGFFGGGFQGVLEQQRATSGYYNCPDNRNDCMYRLPEGCEDLYGQGEGQCQDSTNVEYGRLFGGACPQCTETADQPCQGLQSGACPANISPTETAGYFIISGAVHDFLDVTNGSSFMNQDTVWGGPNNFKWLAEVARIALPSLPSASPITQAPSNAPVTDAPVTPAPSKNPTSSPTGSGICSNDSIVPGSPCSEDSECACASNSSSSLPFERRLEVEETHKLSNMVRRLGKPSCGDGTCRKSCEDCGTISDECTTCIGTEPPTTPVDSLPPSHSPTTGPTSCGICILPSTVSPSKTPSISPTTAAPIGCLDRNSRCNNGGSLPCCSQNCKNNGRCG